MVIHINLMSQQLVPNVIPSLSVSAEKIYLVVAGDAFKENATHLKDFYHSKGIDEVELYFCDDPNDFYSLKHKALELYKDIQAFHPKQPILLNATCGTKPMSLAFTMVFDDLENQCMPIYTDTLNKRVIILNENEKLPTLPFNDVLSIDDYFYLNHFKVHPTQTDSEVIAQGREELTKGILEHALYYPEAVSIINKISQETNFNNKITFSNSINLTHTPRLDFKSILTLAKEYGLLTYFDEKSVSFANPAAARYLGGGWFEELSYLAAREAGIGNVALNIEGHLITQTNSSNDTLNEFDVVLMNNNQMMLVEAKTINWSKREGKGQETTVKLDSLTKLYGGDFAKGLLVTFFPLTKNIANRINSLRNIESQQVCGFDQLVDCFKKWRKSTE